MAAFSCFGGALTKQCQHLALWLVKPRKCQEARAHVVPREVRNRDAVNAGGLPETVSAAGEALSWQCCMELCSRKLYSSRLLQHDTAGPNPKKHSFWATPEHQRCYSETNKNMF